MLWLGIFQFFSVLFHCLMVSGVNMVGYFLICDGTSKPGTTKMFQINLSCSIPQICQMFPLLGVPARHPHLQCGFLLLFLSQYSNSKAAQIKSALHSLPLYTLNCHVFLLPFQRSKTQTRHINIHISSYHLTRQLISSGPYKMT